MTESPIELGIILINQPKSLHELHWVKSIYIAQAESTKTKKWTLNLDSQATIPKDMQYNGILTGIGILLGAVMMENYLYGM